MATKDNGTPARKATAAVADVRNKFYKRFDEKVNNLMSSFQVITFPVCPFLQEILDGKHIRGSIVQVWR